MKALMLVGLAAIALTACGKSDQSMAVSPESNTGTPTVQAAAATPVSNPGTPAATGAKAKSKSTGAWTDLSPDMFRKRYDKLAQDDGSDVITRMKKTKDGVVVTLGDAQFQRGVAEMKKLDLANGRFQSNLGSPLHGQQGQRDEDSCGGRPV